MLLISVVHMLTSLSAQHMAQQFPGSAVLQQDSEGVSSVSLKCKEID